ncbi:FHA domain-containing protein [Streptomyces sp. NBC_01476]|uniref:FHA domain-containing protein n=1 Tax=Streptomyces sp. NBC_01476 TaxID=2903881 RepID=UPI002E3183A7|nr:FHA domain-containing protein [Streptomyces sp. NBC_01476]
MDQDQEQDQGWDQGRDQALGTCPQCGAPDVRPGQLVCRGCFVPFSLMAPPPLAPETSLQSDPQAAPTRILDLGPGVLPDPRPSDACPPARTLRLHFPDGESVPVSPGVRVRLGRDPHLCPAVTFLAARRNLSRVHATVAVDPDGSVWITDEGSTNGTFVNERRLPPEHRTALRTGDTIRLAADVTVRVLL